MLCLPASHPGLFSADRRSRNQDLFLVYSIMGFSLHDWWILTLPGIFFKKKKSEKPTTENLTISTECYFLLHLSSSSQLRHKAAITHCHWALSRALARASSQERPISFSFIITVLLQVFFVLPLFFFPSCGLSQVNFGYPFIGHPQHMTDHRNLSFFISRDIRMLPVF